MLDAMIPASEATLGWRSIDATPFWSEFDTAAPQLLRVGFRLTIWVLVMLSTIRFFRRFGSVSSIQLDGLLSRLSDSRVYLLRQLVMTLKIVACLAYFRDPTVREAAL